MIQMYTSLKFSFPYSLFRIVNTIVSAIVEVKLRVGIKLTDADKKDLAQPFLKVLYLQKNENPVVVNTPSILTDRYSWHFILTDITKRPFKFVPTLHCSSSQ